MLKDKIKAEIKEHGETYDLLVTFKDGRKKLYSDLTRDKKSIETFAKKIEYGNVSSVHLEELIEDFIG